jgi:hypothetical protein
VTAAQRPHKATRGHLSEDAAAECAENPGQAAAGALAHLEECAECRDRVSALAEVADLLQDLPDLVMPAEVALQIEAAIGRETLADAGLAVLEPSAAALRPRRRGHRAAVLGWLTGAAVLLGGLFAVVDVAGGGSVGSSASSAAGPAAVPQAQTTASTPHAAPNLQSGGGFTQYRGSAGAAGSAAGYSSVQQWVGAVVPDAAGLATRSVAPVPAAAACVTKSPVTGSRLVATSAADLGGAPAVLAVYADGNDTSAVLAVVFQAPCGASNPTILHEDVVPVG